jgi:hypothetical protein
MIDVARGSFAIVRPIQTPSSSMPSSQRKTLRFAAGSPSEYRSAIWRLWVQGNDVYLAARTMISMLKLSLHRSGAWRLAWTDTSGQRARNSSDRVEERWSRPAPFRPGWIQGPALIVPNPGTKRPFQRAAGVAGTPIRWSEPPRPGHKLHFTILFADSTAPPDSWQTVFRSGDQSVGVLDQRNGTRVVLCRRAVPMVEKESSYVLNFAADMKITYPDSIPEVVEASVFSAGIDDAGHPYLLDIPLGWENVFAAPKPTEPTGAA